MKKQHYILTVSVILFFMGIVITKVDLSPVNKDNPAKPAQSIQEQNILNTGIALTPKKFPNHDKADVEDMFNRGKVVGDYAVFIYQWSEPNLLKIAGLMVEMSSKYKLQPMLGLSPTILGGFRDRLDVPPAVKNKAKNNLSFSNPEVHLPFIDTVVALARLKPPYLCLATEINLLAFKNAQEYLYFAKVYRELYPVVKKISPSTKIFVSFQWDYMQLLDKREPNKLKEHTKLINIFKPQLDVLAFTSYPADHYSTVSVIPEDYYAKIHNHIDIKDEVVFMEIGWPGRNDPEQTKFVQRLPQLMAKVKPNIVAWSLLHDVQTSELSSDLATTGLLTTDGQEKPAYKSFVELKKNNVKEK
jgi:hypothetical protein